MMKIGELYQLNEFSKSDYEKKLRGITSSFGLKVYFENPVSTEIYPLDSFIVPIEILKGKQCDYLIGVSSCKVKALFLDGKIGTIFVDSREWEQVT